MSRTVFNFIVIFIAVMNFIAVVKGARILGVFPYPSHSHQVIFRSFSMELAKKGHEVMIFTTHSGENVKRGNYTEINLPYVRDTFKKNMNYLQLSKDGVWAFIKAIYDQSDTMSEAVLSHPDMQRLISANSTEKFDLIVTQCLFYDAIYALSIRFNAPMIGISSLPMLVLHHYIVGNPLIPAYSPDVMLGLTDHMNLWERMTNLYYASRILYEYLYTVLPKQDKIMRKYIGQDMPPIRELSKYLSLIFFSVPQYFPYPRPNVPSVINIGGFRLQRPSETLPSDLKKILDNAKEGFIYFSLGSNIKSKDLPKEVLNVFISAFAELPYTILWKFEVDNLPNTPDNLILRKWLPQEAVLAHPNIALFITQGGFQSLEEAIHNAVPMIGFPILSDQTWNVNRLVTFSVAKKLSIHEVDKKTLKRTIHEVVTNKSYKAAVTKLRDLFRDLPHPPMENAIWWTEHVIRHKGAPHLWNRSREMPWYELLMLDVLAIILLGLVVLSFAIFTLLRYTWRRIACLRRRSNKQSVELARKQK
ncbi:hypothetical protein KM043_014496 [Ampulex compressa]|nr:hypothetical protein KM043_014496 [Ampulex compressa]